MLALQIYDSPDKTELLADLTAVGGRLRFGTNEHGFESLQVEWPEGLGRSFDFLARPGLPHVVVVDGAGQLVWEGRLEDRALVPGGLRPGAFGYWRAFHDTLFNSFLSHGLVADWKPVPVNALSTVKNGQWVIGVSGLPEMGLKDGESYADGDGGAFYFEIRSDSEHDIAKLAYGFDSNLDTDWEFKVWSYSSKWAGGTLEATIAAVGGGVSSYSGTVPLTAARPIVLFKARNKSGSAIVHSGDSGETFVKLTQMNLYATSTGPTAQDVIEKVMASVAAQNSGQVYNSVATVDDPGDVLTDQMWFDVRPVQVLNALAESYRYEAQVWEGRRLFFRPEGSGGRTLYVNVVSVEFESSLNEMFNEAYGVYQGVDGVPLVTAVSQDAVAADRHGVVRQTVVSRQTTSSTEATAYRDAALADGAELVLRAKIVFESIENEVGGEVALYMLRAGDTIVLRNLPPAASTLAANVRRFVIRRTMFMADAYQMDVEPKRPSPSLVTLVSENFERQFAVN
jgi:hypothetical protein